MVIIIKRIIEVIKYLLIGFIQGITEIFPISSSGHLSLTYFVFNISNDNKLNLTVFLHFASCLALIVFYKKDIINIVKGSYLYVLKKKENEKKHFLFLLYLIIATIPSILVGFFIKPLIEKTFNNIYFIALGFLLTSIILLYKPKQILNSTYTFKNTLLTGIFQSFALFPGLSRSGTTLFGSKIAKLDENNGKRFAFFLLLPISLGSFILSLFDISNITNSMVLLYSISFISSFIATLISLKLFINRFNYKHNIFFSIYLWIVCFVIFLFL